ncbi:MAG: tyrosine-type recombinase/integrase [Candidatus Izemoplasmatales bacterium]
MQYIKPRILITQTKTHKNRYLYLSEKTLEILEDYLSLRPQSNSEYLLINHRYIDDAITNRKIDHMLEKIKKDLQIPKKVSISPHKFRHTYATIALNNGADLVHVQKLLGHTTLRETQKYTHKSESI